MNRSSTIGAQAIFMSPAVLLAATIMLPPLFFILYTSVHGTSLSLHEYREIASSSLFRRTLGTTLVIAVASSVLSVFLAFIVAVHLARQTARRRTILLVLVLLPLWTSILVKCFAFTIILGRDGILNGILSWLFNTKIQLPLVLNRIGLFVGLTNSLVPIAVFPILASVLAIDDSVYRAASIMGAKPARILRTITIPLSLPGILAGLFTTFVYSLGAYIVPSLLGGPRDQMLSNLVDFYNRQVLDWPRAAAISVVLLAMISVFGTPLAFWRQRKGIGGARV
ncbi:ABC transporter permease [Bradyrhizobium uaiense]|uniref:ABC transporter permease n=1 Tax=Bradyrhizobium uaiense TaxID=2594946 RepID=A0A6P1BSS6_9BRAD|nr:ABC transporter permease [Bradyrhizobium uaiense]NEV01379.1 ABC transporter permease [Bradyrhizobium uaiense]